MKFSVSIAEFQKLLQKTIPAIPPKSTLPVLEHLHFSAKNGLLRIIATDQEITIMSLMTIQIDDEGSLLVPARRLNEIAKALESEGNLTFKADMESYEITLLTPKGKYSMKGLDSEEYLDIPELFKSTNREIEINEDYKEPPTASFKKDEIVKLTSTTAHAVATDDFRPAMTGVLFQFRTNLVNAVATDSYRLVKTFVTSESNEYPDDLDIIIPARAVEILKRVDSDVKMFAIQTLMKTTHLRFEFGNTIFVTRIIGEKFPPYETVIPQSCPNSMIINQKELLNSVKRVSLFTSNISKQVKFILSQDSLDIIGEDEEVGTHGKETLTCEYNGDNMEVGFNFRFMEEALVHTDSEATDNKILFGFSEENKPVLVKPNEPDPKVVMILMPVRIR
ncbi:MAG: Beta sliding clamp [Bacteroidota bacterium]|nr:Beta sliding clamp [Bacteroidota bacterium]